MLTFGQISSLFPGSQLRAMKEEAEANMDNVPDSTTGGKQAVAAQTRPQTVPMKQAPESMAGRQDWERLLARLVPHDPQNQWYCSPNIPQKKLDRAIRKYASGVKGDDVLALLDGTLLRSAEMGFLLTMEGVHYRRSGKGGAFRWSEIAGSRPVGSTEIDIRVNGGGKIRISCGVGLLVRDRLQKLFTLIAGRETAESGGSS
jgi:hypothetical protein